MAKSSSLSVASNNLFKVNSFNLVSGLRMYTNCVFDLRIPILFDYLNHFFFRKFYN